MVKLEGANMLEMSSKNTRGSTTGGADQSLLNGGLDERRRSSGVSLGRRSDCFRWIRGNMLLVAMVIAMVSGIAAGWCLHASGVKLSPREQIYLRFPGELFLRALKMLIVPLLTSSLICGLASLDFSQSKKIGLRAVVYYMSTTILAICIGIILVMSIKPGDKVKDLSLAKMDRRQQLSTTDAMLDLIRNCVPANLVEATFRTDATKRVEIENEPDVFRNLTEIYTVQNQTTDAFSPYDIENSSSPARKIEVHEMTKVDISNVLGLVVFSIVFGMILSDMKEKCQILIDFFNALNDVIMRLVSLVMWFSPVGIFFLIMAQIVSMKEPARIFAMFGYYSATVCLGLVLHGWVALPLIFFAITRRNPIKYIVGMFPALLTALGTSSSSAALPVTLNCAEVTNGIDQRITRFILPIGATINMDGTALYEAVAPIFIAQYRGMDLDLAKIVTIAITATFASIGASTVPQSGLVTMVMVLTAIGLPASDVSLIVSVDWLLDRFRTTTNVLGDSLGAGIVAHLSRHELSKQDSGEMEKAN